MTSLMRRWGALGALLSIVITLSFPAGLHAQESESVRKVVSKVAPQYPEIARKMRIHGTVKLEVAVGANGSPKSVQVKGGHPMLAQAAQTAVSKWRWEPDAHETTEVVDIRFEDE